MFSTRTFLSGLITPGGIPGQIVSAWRSGAFRLVLSEFLLAEIATTLTRPKLASLVGWPPATAEQFVFELRAACDVVEPAALPLAYPRDPDHIPVLTTLLAGQGDVLVTGDADLLALSGQFLMETPRQFVRRCGDWRLLCSRFDQRGAEICGSPLRGRLAELGARRIRKGGGYCSHLKPDYKPGDEIVP